MVVDAKLFMVAILMASPARAEAQAQARDAQPAAAARLSDPAAVVAEVRRIVAESYVLPEKRPALDAALTQGLESGRYDVREPGLLADRINADLERVGRDRHLNFTYDPQRHAVMSARTTDNQPDLTAFEVQVRRDNHGVRELRLLPGNVRYMDLTGFEWIGDESEAALEDAMRFLSGGDAVIIDLRHNGGGSPRAVHQIISHFMEPDRPLITFHRGAEVSPMMSSLRELKTPRMIGKPLYVLTSGVTGSAAEEFVGHVDGYKLGELVGANTSGGAYMNQLHPLAGGFILSVSTGRPVLAATGKDWEARGFAPTLPAPAEAALDTAHVHALRNVAAAAEPSRRAELEALAAGLEAVRRPSNPAAPLEAYAGAYGDRKVILENGKLWFANGARPRRALVPLGGHVFTLADDPLLRLTFHGSGARIDALTLGPATAPAVGPFERTG